MENKPFKSINEQIDLLKERELIINDISYVHKVLSHINYYRLSGYTLTLRKNNKFYKNITMEQVMQIYNFDAELRTALLYLLEYIEVSFRTHLGYFHSKEYGALGYINKDTFKNDERCSTPHIYGDTLKEAFLQAFNNILKNKDEILKRYEEIIQALLDTTKLDEEHYNPLSERYKAIENKIADINDKRIERNTKQERIEEFIKILEKSFNVLTEFDDELWNAVIEIARGNSERGITFVFKDEFEL